MVKPTIQLRKLNEFIADKQIDFVVEVLFYESNEREKRKTQSVNFIQFNFIIKYYIYEIH